MHDFKQAYRTASREGMMGITCLMDHRLDYFVEDGGTTYYIAPNSTYWSGQGRKHKRPDPAGDHIADLVMIPIDAMAKALARMFSI